MLEQVKRAAVVAVCWSGTGIGTVALAQYPGWQQRADYTMEIALDTAHHSLSGHSRIAFTNASPDSLDRLHFHLFFNAFRPGSMMDVRSRTIADPDPRVGSRIAELPEDEWGSSQVQGLTVAGIKVPIEHDGTLLTASLLSPIPPGGQVELELEWQATVPRQIRRSGWMNAEGIEYSMTQWYPKLCAYDHWGWHTDPYVGREFHGIFGDYDVTIEAPEHYVIGGTGELQPQTRPTAWHFKAKNVIDFAWAADPDYVIHSTRLGEVDLHCYHQQDAAFDSAWSVLPDYAARAMAFFNELIGPYPYPQYSIIQGGDGGMEYPMATLITGKRSLRSLVGVTVHEMAHSWFQAILATNESLYEFMDEGMTSYAASLCMQHLFEGPESQDPFRYSYAGYIQHAKSGQEEPLSTHADHYSTNRGYGIGAYAKGEVLVAQLRAVIGPDALDAGLKDYFQRFAFKHPGPVDLMRCMERASGVELDWYFQYFIHTTHTVDCGISRVDQTNGAFSIDLEKVGGMPMPVAVEVVFEDGSRERFFIPLRMMRGAVVPDGATLLEDWTWVNPTYRISRTDARKIAEVHLDPDGWVADVNDGNDHYPFEVAIEEPVKAGKRAKRRNAN
jgi:hypothetical protein